MTEKLKTAIYALIVHYVDRQYLVVKAMLELRPDIMTPSKLTPEQRFAYRSDRNGRGLWGENDEWAYRLHGIGCHLTHTATGEVIGWDAGYRKQFDPNWFVDHLTWRLSNDLEDDMVNVVRSEIAGEEMDSFTLRKAISPIFEKLEESGYLKAKAHRYILTENSPL